MRTQSVVLSEADGASLDALAARYPGASLHLIHLAVLRVGLRLTKQDRTLVRHELAQIQQERRARRQSARAVQGGAG
jgi:hypothetical protein